MGDGEKPHREDLHLLSVSVFRTKKRLRPDEDWQIPTAPSSIENAEGDNANEGEQGEEETLPVIELTSVSDFVNSIAPLRRGDRLLR
jgi:hypothetical protein